ncbi:MAG: hypothetical protein ACLGHM_09460 [Actinomycetes bacterium]
MADVEGGGEYHDDRYALDESGQHGRPEISGELRNEWSTMAAPSVASITPQRRHAGATDTKK